MKTIVHPPCARAVLLAAAASLSASAVSAQTSTLPEVRVTATRFSEPSASLPMGVSVITADEIRASGATTINDAVVRLLGVPGRQDLFNGGDVTLDLRGFGATADNNQVVIVDGLRLSEADLGGTRLAGIPIDSVERIEVLRGSGAVLYGEGATGGVIVITTKAGSGRQQASGASVYAAAGTHALRDLRASGIVSTPNGFTLDANAQKRQTKGFRANSASDTQAGSVGGQWSSGWLRLGARVARDELDAGLPGSLTAAQYAADPRQSTKPFDHGNIRNERLTAFAQADVGAWQLAFDAGRREKKLRSLSVSSFGASNFDYDIEATTYALRAKHEAKLGEVKNALVLGADVGDWEREILGTFGSVATQRSRAFYAKDDVTLQGGTRISLGGRTERIEKDSTSSGTGFEDRQNAWELGVSHPFSAAWTGWARVGRSFRLANVDEFNFTAPGVILQPQVSRDAELGARWSYATGKVEARLYRSALTDEIGFDPNAAGSIFGANTNFDPTRRQGLELDWNQALASNLGLRVNAIVRKATFRSGPYAGNDVPLVPRKALAVRADWAPVAGHRVNAGLNWVSSQHPDFDNACKMPSYTTADARYTWQFHRNAELGVGVTNLFDRKFFTQAFRCAGGVTNSIYPEPGRQFTASLRVQF
ncbi:MAG TPA: TonB-dependent receptor [Ramlibacter sp.]|nr:TonB-dependent receptor [Ramlibacter sp.]